MIKFIKMYIWSVKTSYSYMKGYRNLKFWIILPFRALQITYKILYE